MKKGSLTKSDLAWVLIRVFGVAFACMAISSIVAIINGIVVLSGFSPPAVRHLPKVPYSGFFWQTYLVPTLLQIVMAWYFLKDGKLVHDLVMWTKPGQLAKRSDSMSVETPAEVPDKYTTLTPTEESEFTEWLEDELGNSTGELEDQIAKFRDYQRSQR